MDIAIIHPGSGNVTSVLDCMERLGAQARLVKDPDEVGDASHLILPGQGRFGPVIRFLRHRGWDAFIESWLINQKSFLGICVGMQVLFEGSAEDPEPGLGILPGRLVELKGVKRPMMGWTDLEWNDDPIKGAVYFVNSYVLPYSEFQWASANYGGSFCAAVRKDSLTAFQFHPEKSGKVGKEILQKWLNS